MNKIASLSRGVLLTVLLLTTFVKSSATTIREPDFSELVRGAEQVVAATVQSVVSAEVDGTIRTRVTFSVSEVLAGAPIVGEQTLTLQLLGGQVGNRVLEVDGMPNFKLGTNMVLFVAGNGKNVCPLVGWGHGKYLVKEDANDRRYMVRDNTVPLTALAEVQEPLEVSASSARVRLAADAMSFEQFKHAVRTEKERFQNVQ